MSLRARLVSAFAYVLVLVLVALAVPFALSVSNRVEAEVEAQGASQAHLVAASVAGILDRPVELQRLVVDAGSDVRGRVVVVGPRGRLLADSEGSRLLGRSYADRPEIAAVLADGNVAQGRRTSESLGGELLYTSVPVVRDGNRVGAVRITRSAGPVDARIRRDRIAVGAIAVAALALGLALAWLLAGSLAAPLRSLARTAQRLGDGDLSARADVAGPTEQQEVAAAFNDMAARLERVLEAQREFVANASHQLRTPLTGLRLRLEAAQLQADDPALARELEAAEHETQRLAKLLTGLLALAREGAPQRSTVVDLAVAVDAACGRWRPEAEATGRRLVAAPGEARALASEDDVAVALDNLIENALLYSPPGTTVTVEARTADGVVSVAVTDEGPGLAPGEEERVFERFARGSAGRDAPGTGLGLAIVRTLARRWGGEARIASLPGGGARAELSLPAAPASVAGREPVVA
jgi:two-component system, OmpR family, sensor kinase